MVYSQACFCFFACLQSVLTATLTENSPIARDKGQCSLDFYKHESTKAKCVFVLCCMRAVMIVINKSKMNAWMLGLFCVCLCLCVYRESWTIHK